MAEDIFTSKTPKMVYAQLMKPSGLAHLSRGHFLTNEVVCTIAPFVTKEIPFTAITEQSSHSSFVTFM